MEALATRISNPDGIPLIDPGVRRLMDLDNRKIANRPIPVPDGVQLDHGLITNVLVANLAGLQNLTIPEIIDVRESLSDYLPHFRKAMIDLARDISEMDGFPELDIAHEVNRRWDGEISPKLSEIKRTITKASYPRRILDSISTKKDVLASTASSLILATGSIAASISTLLPAVATASYPFIKALNETIKQRDEIRANELFFLYSAQKQTTQALKQRP